MSRHLLPTLHCGLGLGLWWVVGQSGCGTAVATGAPDSVAVAAQAEAVYQATLTHYAVGTAELDAVYRWSVRWRDAQARIDPAAAAHAHLARMQDLSVRVAARAQQGLAAGLEPEAATFYLLEAQYNVTAR